MDKENDVRTVFLDEAGEEYLGDSSEYVMQPRLFVCFEHEILEFVLSGKQWIGRPSRGQVPDIPITNKYVSRRHGFFETKNGKVTFTAAESTNGTVFRRKKLKPGETVELWDADELIIPTSGDDDGVDVMMVCALVENRINIWRDLRLSSRDALTGLPGRNAFRTWYLMNCIYSEEELSLFILDIDKFKRINDVYGHSAGDKALKLLADQLLVTAENKGYICRWGGDEFTGILSGDAGNAKKALDDMRKRLSRIKIDDQFSITVSAGVTGIGRANETDDVDSLVMRADKALYEAKENGRDCVCVVEQ